MIDFGLITALARFEMYPLRSDTHIQQPTRDKRPIILNLSKDL